MNDIKIREFESSDWQVAWDLWGQELKDKDNTWQKDKVDVFLERNPGQSFVAVVDGELVATVLCGFDGRRGYIYNLAVKDGFKRRGIGTALTKLAISNLKRAGADKVHLMVLVENQCAHRFYQKLGFSNNKDIELMSSGNV
jgi:ribosomal protein S18 acetylase RimI-like enzyme